MWRAYDISWFPSSVGISAQYHKLQTARMSCLWAMNKMVWRNAIGKHIYFVHAINMLRVTSQYGRSRIQTNGFKVLANMIYLIHSDNLQNWSREGPKCKQRTFMIYDFGIGTNMGTAIPMTILMFVNKSELHSWNNSGKNSNIVLFYTLPW